MTPWQRCALAFALVAAHAPGVRAAGDAVSLAPQAVAQHVYLLRGAFEPARQPDGNTVVFAGNVGWIVFDTGRHAAHSARILDFVHASGGRVDAIVNSHWHLDHIGGNARIREDQPGVRVYASAAVEYAFQAWLKDYRGQLEQMLADPKSREADKQAWRTEIALIDSGARLVPDVRISGTRDWQVAQRRVRVGLETDAVSGGDVWLYDRRSRVIAAGDLVTLPVPFFDTACPARWAAALAGLEDLPFEKLVPGHGPVLDRYQFSRYREAFDALLACAASDTEQAACVDAWIVSTGEFYADSEHARAREMLAYYFQAHLRAPPEQRNRFCPREQAAS